MRIVSLTPAATEIVCALGMGSRLVARSHECDHPRWVRGLPHCTGPKFEADGTSYDVDQRVRAVLQEGLGVYRVDADALGRLAPDVILTQDQCEVCAVSLRDLEEAACLMLDSRPVLVSLRPARLADVLEDMRRVARSLGIPARGQRLAETIMDRMDGVAGRARDLDARPRVALVEWIAPLMAAGNWMPELVALAGGACLFGEPGGHSPWMDPGALAAADPDVIVVMPCGFDLRRTRRELPALEAVPGWDGLRAVREGRVALADGHAFFNRPGPRIVESLEILAEILHPSAFDFGHQGKGWV